MDKPKLDIGSLGQIGVVVRDIEKVVKFYTDHLGIGPWRIRERETETVYRGEKRTLRMKLAFARLGPLQFELIQPVGDEESLYTEFLKTRGEGLHHLGFNIENIEKAVADYQSAGIGVVQGRWAMEGGFAYMDTEAKGGFCIELIQWRPVQTS
jgi:methylmalonyl-CoA/ethylmalonyl-CoA epimerase